MMLADGSSRANHFTAHVAIAERSLNVCSCHGYSDSPSEILGGELRAGSKRSAGRVVVGLLAEGVVEVARSNRVASEGAVQISDDAAVVGVVRQTS